jgi:hypothetical protein
VTHDASDNAFQLAHAESDKIDAEWQALLAEMEATPPEQRPARRKAENWDARFIELQRRRGELAARLHEALQASVGSSAKN